MVSKQRKTWRWHESSKASHELQRRHDPVLGTVIAQVFAAIRHSSARQPPESIEGERQAGAVSHEALAPEVVVGRNDNPRMHIETIVCDRVRPRWEIAIATEMVAT